MPSINHHFLPQNYLKGFTDSNETYKIWHVTERRFIKKGNLFSTASYFYEKGANSIFINNKAYDFIEDYYSKLDNEIATVLTKIRGKASGVKFELSHYDILTIEHFIGVLFWRLPINQELIKNELLYKTVGEISKIVNEDNDQEVIDKKFIRAFILLYNFED